tara:strand:+ start:2118 stop:2492 length:375 start_codon:yes stop_codon:yes gene_type:complete
MKFVITFFLFLAISYYIFLQRKKIVEGHGKKESDDAAKTTDINNVNEDLDSKEEEIEKLLEEVNVLIEKQKKLTESIKELEKEGGGGPAEGGESKICDMTDCKTKNVTRKCSEFKKASGVKCVD